MKLNLWQKKVKDGNLNMFENETLNKTKTKITGNLEVAQLAQAHLASLRKELQSYLPGLSEKESKLI